MASLKIPLIYKIAVLLCLFGFAFPIYGFPLIGYFKLTFWRIGLFILVILLPFYWPGSLTNRKSTIILFYAFVFFIARSWSYFFSSYEGKIISQLVWYFEGIIYLLIIFALANRYKNMFMFYIRSSFFIGFLSIGLIFLQFILARYGQLFKLPFSESSFGISVNFRAWTYPLYGGRIIGSFFEPNMAGTMCALFYVFFFPLFFLPSENRVVNKHLLFISLVICLLALYSTGSRQSFLSVVIISIIFILIKKGNPISSLRTKILRYFTILFFTLGVLYIGGLFSKFITPFGETQENVILRSHIDETVVDNSKHGNPYYPRSYFYHLILSKLKVENIPFGEGEGSSTQAGVITVHNAFLITLFEMGVVGLFLLITFLGIFLKSTWISYKRYRGNPNVLYCLSSVFVVIAWIILIFINWAQLNQSVSYFFLAYPIISLIHLKS